MCVIDLMVVTGPNVYDATMTNDISDLYDGLNDTLSPLKSIKLKS